MQWDRFAQTCPELADIVRARFVRDQLVLVGTLRNDGWPRISPCEVDLAAGHLDRASRQILREYTVVRRIAGSITFREERTGPLTMAP